MKRVYQLRPMWLLSVLIIAITVTSCVTSDYAVERFDDGKTSMLPLQFDFVSGARNGDIVRSEVRFAGGNDYIRMNLTVHLAPSAECTSGSYSAVIGGKRNEGTVSCESLAFQGGQDNPAIGGKFLLKDTAGTPIYRVTMPSTQMQRRFSP